MLRLLQHPAVLLLLCVSLAGTPVTYRGGATNPHPHMFFEFLMDAEAGVFDHHHGDADESEDEDTPEHHHETATRTGFEAGARSPEKTAGVVQDVPVPSSQMETSASEDTRAPGLWTPDPFGASISAFVAGDVGQLAFILPTSALPQSTQIDTAFAHGDRILNGIPHSPIAPPPR